MNHKNLSLLLVAVITIGIFALPQSVALFSGQHSWYDLSAGPNDVPCEKCHGDIADEMIDSDNGAHRNLTCAMCHRTCFSNYTYASGEGSGSTAGEEAHAASTVECMDCHGIYHEIYHGSYYTWDHWSYSEYSGNCDKCHWSGGYSDFISAGGFGIEDPANPGHNTTATDTGEKAAHRKFVLDAMNESLMEGANEACIGCHTRVGVNITWTKNVVLEFSASENEYGNWSIPDFSAAGSNVTASTYRNNWTNSY
ncbi:MAG: conserved hypothetical protein, membrane or secreted [Candidatus Syntrophoarchaeum caldarius]|uniref:Uncharacterized protein n=1 Tax=Candidatus Syntropharchaeum caldarium TaxID=1838285 RepID=A0A1F2PB57_9EURY|nr:MAG: conserved hypothetical protein, membrane or secreted [Candidatus Syntrophoarchaeum caldarius]